MIGTVHICTRFAVLVLCSSLVTSTIRSVGSSRCLRRAWESKVGAREFRRAATCVVRSHFRNREGSFSAVSRNTSSPVSRCDMTGLLSVVVSVQRAAKSKYHRKGTTQRRLRTRASCNTFRVTTRDCEGDECRQSDVRARNVKVR